jgi:hypothetical protein
LLFIEPVAIGFLFAHAATKNHLIQLVSINFGYKTKVPNYGKVVKAQ